MTADELEREVAALKSQLRSSGGAPRRWLPLWLLAVCLLLPMGAWALGPRTFAANDPIRAQDFQAMWDAVRALEGQALDSRVTALEGAPAMLSPGAVVAFAGEVSVPEGWLLCDGGEVSRTGATTALFAAIGIAYGGGDGVDTFNLPDYRGLFLRGLDDPLGDGGAGRDPSRSLGSLQGDATARPAGLSLTTTVDGSHQHDINGLVYEGGAGLHPSAAFNGGAFPFSYGTTTQAGGHAHTISASGFDTETRPVNAAVNYLIKL